jgi:thiol:disulfide interchange protein DsbD
LYCNIRTYTIVVPQARKNSARGNNRSEYNMVSTKKLMLDTRCWLGWVNGRCMSLLAMFLVCVAPVIASEFTLGSSGSITPLKFLPADEAFQFTALQDNGQLLLRWQIAPGYYLYRERLSFRQGEQVLNVMLPAGLDKTDEYFGEVQVYYSLLELSLPLDSLAASIEIHYQGCADAGLCYPPRLQLVALK